ncbi:hypothetical protein ZWY2020_005714 [Hordeum vulgare]|nr:hypothetical protein ZWY2020_005714 [Hordeum vulgare]
MNRGKRERDRSFPIFLAFLHDHLQWRPKETANDSARPVVSYLLYDVAELLHMATGAVWSVVSVIVYDAAVVLVHTASGAVRPAVSSLMYDAAVGLLYMTTSTIRSVVFGVTCDAVVEPANTITDAVRPSSPPASSKTSSSGSKPPTHGRLLLLAWNRARRTLIAYPTCIHVKNGRKRKKIVLIAKSASIGVWPREANCHCMQQALALANQRQLAPDVGSFISCMQ